MVHWWVLFHSGRAIFLFKTSSKQQIQFPLRLLVVLSAGGTLFNWLSWDSQPIGDSGKKWGPQATGGMMAGPLCQIQTKS